MNEPWVSVEQVATHLGVAKDTVYRWIDAKSLPAQRIGRLWKFKLSDVDVWVRTGMAADGESQVTPGKGTR
jgi:excisionase family DNA binding protein